jgi:hypothetical protein
MLLCERTPAHDLTGGERDERDDVDWQLGSTRSHAACQPVVAEVVAHDKLPKCVADRASIRWSARLVERQTDDLLRYIIQKPRRCR